MGSGRRAAAAGWSPPEAPACFPAPPGVSLCCAAATQRWLWGPDWSPGRRARGAGRWYRAGWGVRAPRNGNFAGSAGAGGRASSLHCARRPRRRPRGVLQPGPLRRPAGQFPRRRGPGRPRLGPRPAASLPLTRARPPGLRSWVGVGLRPLAAGTRRLGFGRAPGVPGPRRPGGLGSGPSVSAPSPATPRSPPLK